MFNALKYRYLKAVFYSVFFSSIILVGCKTKADNDNAVPVSDSICFLNVPPQPSEDTWSFIRDFQSPMWTRHLWDPATPAPDQTDLSKGVIIENNFPDPQERLTTAYEDLRCFLAAGDMSIHNGGYVIKTAVSPGFKGEAFRLEIGRRICHILAGDVEGIRRGIFYLEDEMLRLKGPFLTIGTVERHPVIKRRISRCVYGPIKRPPAMRDELMDTVNYYPDQYLNRLAHEGVNGLWLTVDFRDLVSTKFTPGGGKDAEKRLARLKKTVARCLRYGIRTYIFTIEPRAWGNQPPYYNDIEVLEQYPELGGVRRGNLVYFCPMSETAHQYLYESTNKIFKAVPELGGIINISHGERATTCLSTAYQLSSCEVGDIDCPRCSKKEPWEILNASLSAMEEGMHNAAPDAELISWLYMSHPVDPEPDISYSLGDWVYEIAAHTPKGVIHQFNFETGVTMKEFGKEFIGGDYWISNPGPSSRFSRIAEIAQENGTRVSAKIQTSNSHEVATIPFIPVPSLLYQKFSSMHRLGVSHTMLAWYFGNDPGVMLKSAGDLSFKPFPGNEDIFLNRLALLYWKKEDVSKIVEAWKHFSAGFENYPLSAIFQRYGPMHDGPVWPLLLKPLDAPLSPTWQIGSSTTLEPWPPSGDRIGECLGEVLTLQETVELARRMTTLWDEGIVILDKLEKRYRNEPERILDINVAKALGIQFRSGYNILHFYLLREEMFWMEDRKRLEILKQLTDIIHEEIHLNEQLIELCKKDSRLGFHSEAEGYKYFPEKIQWRMQQLRNVLANDVPEVRKIINKNQLLFPEYTGKIPEGPIAVCIDSNDSIWLNKGLVPPRNLQWQQCSYGSDKKVIQWASAYDKEALYILVSERIDADLALQELPISGIQVRIEPKRLWPCKHFVFKTMNANYDGDQVRVIKHQGEWFVAVRIPFKNIGLDLEHLRPIRLDVKAGSNAWRPNNPLTYRLNLGTDNPSDLGWLTFDDKK